MAVWLLVCHGCLCAMAMAVCVPCLTVLVPGDTVELKVLYTGEDVPEVAQSRKKDDNLVRQTFAVLGAGMETHVIFQASLRDAVSERVLIDSSWRERYQDGFGLCFDCYLQAAMWMDGIRYLMNEAMKETETLKEIESLLQSVHVV